MADSDEYGALFDKMHGAFEAALVSCMDYFRGVWDDKNREIVTLKKRLDESDAEISRLKGAIAQKAKTHDKA